ncbi:MAG: hypothetical protein VW851_05240 [Cryomorphaceae bacterium]|jgi:uncharacterized membrane-anchored protein
MINNMDSLTKKAVKSGLFFGGGMAVFKALMDYYDDSFNILSIVLYGIVLGIFWTLFRRFELRKQAKDESTN